MRKLLKMLAVFAAIAAIYVGLVLSEWLPPATTEEEAAVALLEPAPAHVAGERNAFPLLWLFRYDIPESELAAIAAADAAAWARRAAESMNVGDFKSTAEGRYPVLPEPPSNDPLLCQNWGSECLARVRADVERSRARVAEFGKRLERGDLLDAYDHNRYGFQLRFDAPIAGPGALFPLQLTATALDYVDGKRDAAFARLCRNTATWRRLRAHGDTLIGDMLGVAQMSNATRLYAEMLAEQPADFVPPCPEVFAPLTDTELDQCAVFRQEYLFRKGTMESALAYLAADLHEPGFRDRAAAALVNERHVDRAIAPFFANYCAAPHRERIARRDPAPLPEKALCTPVAWAFDPVGCSVFLAEPPVFDDYYKRALDLDARLKLLATAIWLRTQPADGDRAAQFAARAKSLDSPAHGMTIDTATQRLRMNNLQTARGAVWDIPYGAAEPAATATPATAGAD